MRPGRWIAGLAVSGLVLGLAWTGLAQDWTTRLSLIALRASGLDGVRWLGPDLFAVGPQPYAVVLWCTPVVLSLCGFLLLGFARRSAWAYLAEAAVLFLGASALLTLNTVLSVHLHRTGLSWGWAHYPGLVTVYAVILGACLKKAAPPAGIR
ncbi:MAG TPA: hypothetical protein VLT87_15710 [Thermoanaerobaculia bacterium]|nr:hypothetical protein [Thermoanaerobaculia bacterium]